MKKKIFFPLVFLSVMAYPAVKGKVTDLKGEPIPGVHIFWLNSHSGTVSGIEGEFEIEKDIATDKLIFSNVAYQSDTIYSSEIERPIKSYIK
jgi:hypothetical protein